MLLLVNTSHGIHDGIIPMATTRLDVYGQVAEWETIAKHHDNFHYNPSCGCTVEAESDHHAVETLAEKPHKMLIIESNWALREKGLQLMVSRKVFQRRRQVQYGIDRT